VAAVNTQRKFRGYFYSTPVYESHAVKAIVTEFDGNKKTE
jgi:hypothetical protein